MNIDQLFQQAVALIGAGDVPALDRLLTDHPELARERLPEGAYGYIAGSAGTEGTARANRAAFERWRIVPDCPGGDGDADAAPAHIDGAVRRNPCVGSAGR